MESGSLAETNTWLPVVALRFYHWRLPGEVAEWSNAPDSKSGLRFYRNVGSNPTLSARNENAPCGRFLFPGKGGVDEPTGFDNFVGNKIGQPEAGPEHSEGRGSWTSRAIPPSPRNENGPCGRFLFPGSDHSDERHPHRPRPTC